MISLFRRFPENIRLNGLLPFLLFFSAQFRLTVDSRGASLDVISRCIQHIKCAIVYFRKVYNVLFLLAVLDPPVTSQTTCALG